MTTTLCDAALGLLDKGWSVLPAQPGGKKPLVEWAEFTKRLPDKEEVCQWWKRWPNANVALVTGNVSGLVAVDIDTDRGGIPDPIYDQYPTEMISRTGSGGFHLFYSYPNNTSRVSNRVGADGVDIRGDGGYVIVPPSSHQSGRFYEWLKFGELGQPPPWLLDAAKNGDNLQSEHWLTDLLSGVNKGGRNDSCARLAGYFAGKGVVKDVAMQVLHQWNSKNDPPMAEPEIKRTVDSVYRSAFRVPQKTNNRVSHHHEGGFSVVPFNQYMTKYGSDTVRWDIEDWLPQSTIAFVISPPGHYKTWLSLDLAQSVASGDPFLGHFPVNNPGPVLFVQQEDFHGEIVERLGVIIAAKHGMVFDEHDSEDFRAPIPTDVPIFFHTDRSLRFDDDAVVAALEQRIEALKPKLVIIDPLYSAGKVDDYMAKTAEQMLPLKRMRDKYGCSFVIVHHTKKNVGGGNLREGAWGSQFLNAFLESGWQIRSGNDQNDIICRRHFKAKGGSSPLRISFDISLNQPYKYSVLCEDVDVDASADFDVTRILKDHGDLNMTEMASHLGIHRSTVSRKVNALVKAGAIDKRSNGRFCLPDLPDI